MPYWLTSALCTVSSRRKVWYLTLSQREIRWRHRHVSECNDEWREGITWWLRAAVDSGDGLVEDSKEVEWGVVDSRKVDSHKVDPPLFATVASAVGAESLGPSFFRHWLTPPTNDKMFNCNGRGREEPPALRAFHFPHPPITHRLSYDNVSYGCCTWNSITSIIVGFYESLWRCARVPYLPPTTWRRQEHGGKGLGESKMACRMAIQSRRLCSNGLLLFLSHVWCLFCGI